MRLTEYLHRVVNRADLSASEAHEAMGVILRGEATTAQIAAFLGQAAEARPEERSHRILR